MAPEYFAVPTAIATRLSQLNCVTGSEYSTARARAR
jgi:hypothetical protein